jgi:hypothetical protein
MLYSADGATFNIVSDTSLTVDTSWISAAATQVSISPNWSYELAGTSDGKALSWTEDGPVTSEDCAEFS